MPMQIRGTPNNGPPVGLLERQLSVEMNNGNLWVGVPPSIDPTGRIRISPPANMATTAQLAAFLPLAGGQSMAGPFNLAGNAATALQPVPLQQLTSSLAPYATTASMATALAGFLPLAGNASMTGQFYLSADATAPMQPVTKQQLDSIVAGTGFVTTTQMNTALANYLPLAGNVTMSGAFNLAANATTAMQPVTLQQMTNAFTGFATTASVTTALANYVPLAGNVTLTGPLTLAGDATATLQPVTLQQLRNQPTLNQPNLLGVTDGSNAASGAVGEYFSVVQNTAVTVQVQVGGGGAPGLNWATICQLALPAGDWDVSANCAWDNPNQNPPTDMAVENQAAMSRSATAPDAPGDWPYGWIFIGNHFYNGLWRANPAVCVGTRRYSSATPFTVYLLSAIVGGWAGVTATADGFGSLMARRVR